MKNHIKMIVALAVLSAFTLLVSCQKNTPEDNGQDQNPFENLDKVTYEVSAEAFNNPERGWYIFNAFNFREGQTPTAALNKARVLQFKEQGYTIIHTIYHMYEFVNKPLSQTLLDTFEANMNAIRDGGAKCLLRFAYSNTEKTDPSLWDAPMDIVKGHLDQLKPLLQKHGDVLFAMEAGFVGVWGEWYYTDNFGYQPTATVEAYAPRREVLNKILEVVPKDRMICVRYPIAKVKMFDITYADSVTLATAYNESDLSRVACHNDCFLADSKDTGTFSGSTQRDYWHKETKYLVMGGETCGTSRYSACPNTVEQMQNFHFTYLNRGYHQNVIAQWRNEECFDEIDRRLGYRFVITEGYFAKEALKNEKYEMALKINNVGFAAPVNPRNVEIVFVEQGNAENVFRVQTDADPRYWFASEEHLVHLTFDLPAALQTGKTYDVSLNLPDPKENLYGIPDYSIRLANANVWDETTGFNKLKSVTIQ